jgi:fibronectin-binding autotransporter adhesin
MAVCGPVAAAFGAAYTWRTIATTRGVAFAGFADADKAAEASGLGQVFGEVGLPIMSKRGAIEPFAGLAYVDLHGDGFSENGGAAALKGAGGDSQTGFATVGLRGEARGTVEGAMVSLRGSVAWRGAFGAVTPSERLSFASGGSAFTIDGAPVARDAVVADIDLGVRVSARTRLSLDYNGLAGAGARDQSLKLNLNFSF